MLFIGIDVAMDKHNCCVISSQGEILAENFEFLNSREGFEEFLSLVKAHRRKNEKTKVGLESTGHYSSNLLAFLQLHSFEVTVFNPLSVSRSRAAGSLRRTKTDKIDARNIALLLVGKNSTPYRQQSYHISTLKSLSRARYRLAKEIQPIKCRYKRLIHILFPEIGNVFGKQLYISSVLNLLLHLPGAKEIADCNILSLTKMLSDGSHGRFKRPKAEALKQLAKLSIASYNPADAFELKLVVQRIQFFKSQSEEIEAQIEALMKAIGSPITSIPGIGYIIGAAILAEIGDINNFSTPAKLLAFAGCEPSSYSSGKFTANKTPMVKHGSKYLRNALYQACSMAFLKSPSFRDYIKRKRLDKHHYVAMSHAMKKMTRVIFSVLTNNSPYIEPV